MNENQQQLNWKGPTPLTDLESSSLDVEGVYVIWSRNPRPQAIRAGQGSVRKRLADHLGNPEIRAYDQYNPQVSYASVSPNLRDGIERYLFDELHPRVGEKAPDARPIQVNLPWHSIS